MRLPLLLQACRHARRAAVAALALCAAMPAAGRAEIIIAAIGSSEPPGNPGALVRSGVELAVAALLASGKPQGETIRVILSDDACSAAGGEAVARNVLTEGARLVIGHVCSSAAIAAAPIYAEAGVIFISPGARNHKLTDPRAGPTIFRLAGRADRQAADTVAAIVARYPGKKIAIVNDQMPPSRDLADAVHRGLTGAGRTVVHRETLGPGERDYGDLVRRLKIVGAELLFLPTQPQDLAAILAQMRVQQLAAPVIGGDTLAIPGPVRTADLENDGVLAMLSWTPKPTKDAADRVHSLMQFNRNARTIALQSFAAVEAWAQAMAEAGSTDTAKIAAVLASKQFDTVIGQFRFNERGDATIPSFALHVWSNGSWHRAAAKASRKE